MQQQTKPRAHNGVWSCVGGITFWAISGELILPMMREFMAVIKTNNVTTQCTKQEQEQREQEQEH